uniref:RGS domain-containing protein n=1 Tax=Caenorhabditis tropicalis TaxID=1561998 RepID=A0A1I7UIA9_9PELO
MSDTTPAVAPELEQGLKSYLSQLGHALCGCFGQETQPAPVPKREKEGLPTYEIAFSWSISFENLMKSNHGQKLFAEYLKGEYSDENILFWQACEELKREKNLEKVEEKARIIYEDFISILSPKEVSLDSRVREIVNTNMGRPSATTFDHAQTQIYVLMQRDSYPRFLSSTMYKEIMTGFGVQEEAI